MILHCENGMHKTFFRKVVTILKTKIEIVHLHFRNQFSCLVVKSDIKYHSFRLESQKWKTVQCSSKRKIKVRKKNPPQNTPKIEDKLFWIGRDKGRLVPPANPLQSRCYQRGKKLLEHKLQLLWSITTGTTPNTW